MTNAGEILGESGAILVSDVTDAVIRNSGLIQSEQVGFEAESDMGGAEDTLTFVNAGEVLSEPDGGAAFSAFLYDQVLVRNSGTIAGGGGMRFDLSEDVEIRNSGKIEGTSFQGVIFSSETGVNKLINSGEITGAGAAIRSEASQVILRNSGLTDGAVSLAIAGDKVINSGEIIGDVDLGGGADTYRGQLQGHVTGTVLGGAGEDVLIGGDLKDRLHGGAGNDLLSGRTGGDTFVFGANAGSDRILDFEKGQDSIQILGQAGGFATLTFETAGPHLKIIHDGGEILLLGQAGQPLDASDFLFA